MIQGQNLVIGELGVPSSTLTHTIRLQNARRGGLSAKLQGVQLQTDKGADIVWHLFILGSCDNFYEEWIIGTDQQTNDSTHDQTSNSLFFVGTVGYCLYNVKICQHMSTKHHWAVFQRKADKTQVSSFQALFPQRCSSDQFRRSLVCGLYIYMYIYTHDMHITCLKNQPLIGRKLEKTKGTIHGSPKRTWQEQLVRSNGSWDPGSPATSTGLQGLRWQVRGA